MVEHKNVKSMSKRSRTFRKDSMTEWLNGYVKVHGHLPTKPEYTAFRDGHNKAAKKMRKYFRFLLKKHFGNIINEFDGKSHDECFELLNIKIMEKHYGKR